MCVSLAPVSAQTTNLLLNSDFRFQAFEDTRNGGKEFRSGSVPFWDQQKYDDAVAYRAPRNRVFQTRFPIPGVVLLRPGKTLSQFSLLSEMQLDPTDTVSFSVFGWQTKPGSLQAAVRQVQTDSEAGEWKSPIERKGDDQSPRELRGEPVRVKVMEATSGTGNDFELTLSNAAMAVKDDPANKNKPAAILGLEVTLTNVSNQDVWIYSPSLVKGPQPANRQPALRALPEDYRYLPRTMAKLKRGEPLHIITMGSSIDRGSAGRKLFLYDENSESPNYREPRFGADLNFSGDAVGNPDWTAYFGWWQHYLSYTGRLRLELMRRYDYPINKLLLNFEASDGSSIGESHSALDQWGFLKMPPDPDLNGHAASGKTWPELYPGLFDRGRGAAPDLVIFGSGANEKIDTNEENVAAYEGAIRWFQRHFPNVEFIFCM